MQPRQYVMRDQARDTVHEIMHGAPGARPLLERPSWVAFVLLIAAFHVLAATAPA